MKIRAMLYSIIFWIISLHAMAISHQVFHENGHVIHLVTFDKKKGHLALHFDPNAMQRLSDVGDGYEWMINGSFFSAPGTRKNIPTYFVQKNKLPLSLSKKPHGAFGWNDVRVGWDIIAPRVRVIFNNGKVLNIKGINAQSKLPALWLGGYLPQTRKKAWCVLQVDDSGRIKRVSSQQKLNVSRWHVVLKQCPAAIPAKVRLQVQHRGKTLPAKRWGQFDHILMGVPMLLMNGQRGFVDGKSAFYQHPYARTVIGQLKSGELAWVVVESSLAGLFFYKKNGYWPSFIHPQGMSLPALTDWLVAHDFVHALNLDGGGSSGLIANGDLVVTPTQTSDVYSLTQEQYLSHFISFQPLPGKE